MANNNNNHENSFRQPAPSNIAVWGNRFQDAYLDVLKVFFGMLRQTSCHISIENSFADYLSAHSVDISWATLTEELPQDTDLVLSLGGDGTFLRAAEWVAAASTPIMGINTGHLGYLTGFALRPATCQEECLVLMQAISGDFTVSPRIMLHVESNHLPEGFNPFALNEISVSKGDTTSMVDIHAYVDGHYLADYQADGLVISTPTGSTAYNLSCGGPILQPTLEGIVLSPIAPHSLTLRPLVISASSEVRLEVSSRGERCHVGVDGRTFAIPSDNASLIIRKADRVVNVAQPIDSYFAEVLRKKLRWGEMPLRED